MTGIDGSPSMVHVSRPNSSHFGIHPHSLYMSIIERTMSVCRSG